MLIDLNSFIVNCILVKRCVRVCSSILDIRIIFILVKRCVRFCSSILEIERILRLYYILFYYENDIFYIFNKKRL